MARMDTRVRYYKRLNRYTLFQITFCYVPAAAASVYNLFYTWYGRQVYWIDIESIAMSGVMSILHVWIICRTQGDYLKATFDEVPNARKSDSQRAAREKYLADPLAEDLANDIAAAGFKGDAHRERLAQMTD